MVLFPTLLPPALLEEPKKKNKKSVILSQSFKGY